jgi:hypothetical protein
MSLEQRLSTINLQTTHLIDELHQLNLLRDKFRKATLVVRRARRHARRRRSRV